MGIKILELPENERPREKLLQYGVSSLSTIEILAILLRSGSRSMSALNLATKIVSNFKVGINELADVGLRELMNIDGIGIAKASTIVCAIELGGRIRNTNIVGVKLDSPNVVYSYLKSRLVHLKQECFIVLELNTKNIIFNQNVVTLGILNSSLVHPREVFKSAIRNSAASIIAVHNHPSGNFTPSKEDDIVTERLRKSGDIIGIKLIDHVIIAKSGYYSYRENNKI